MKGLRQKQHRWGAAWGIRKGFNQRFCIERVLTQKSSQRYCLQDVAILTQGKGFRKLQPSCQLDFQQLEMAYLVMSSQICSSCLPHRNCSYSFQHIQASQFFLWKLASAHFRLSVQDDRSKFVRERLQALF